MARNSGTLTKIQIEVISCMGCPFHTTKRHYTSDSFEMAFDYFCTKVQDDGVNKDIASYIEREREMPDVPEWCLIIVN